MAPIQPECWICGEPATTREHKTKRSDLKCIFGELAPGQRLFLHDDKKLNKLVQSLDSRALKSDLVLCEHCNSARTQPHDRAWETMLETLRALRARGQLGDSVRANTIFPYETRRQMLNVHLYFVKCFGCILVEAEGKIPIEQRVFAESLLEGCSCPNLFLQLSSGHALDGKPLTGRSNVFAKADNKGDCVQATWLYQIDGLGVALTYLREPDKWRFGDGIWNPSSFYRKRLSIMDLSGEAPQ